MSLLATFSRLRQIFRSHRGLSTVIMVGGGLALTLALIPVPVYAIGDIIAGFLASIILAFAKFLGSLALMAIGLLVEIVQYNDFINAPAVVKGWVIVRDVCNMFFIVVLLLLAFGTIFKIEDYQYKHHLSKLLIMAVLINFSKFICAFFIDMTQVVTLTFVNGFKDAAAGNFVQGFKLEEMFNYANKSTTTSGGASEGIFLEAALLALITIAIVMVVMWVYLTIFSIRIVALWLLIIISPIAFLLSTVPNKSVEHYAEEWWSYFGKYAATGPILAFTLWLALAMMQFSSNALGDFSVASREGFDALPAVTTTGIGQADTLLSFIIGIIFLLGGLWMAEHLGIVGGGMAAGALHGMKNMGSKAIRWPANRMKENFGNMINKRIASGKLPAWTNPFAVWRAREERRQELHHEAKSIAEGKSKRAYTKLVTGGVDIPYDVLAQRAIEADQLKKFSPLNKEQKAYTFATLSQKLAKNPNNFEAHHMRNALLLGAAPESHNDDIVASDFMANDYEWEDHHGNKFNGLAIKYRPKADGSGYEIAKDNNGHQMRGALTKEEEDGGYVQLRHSYEIVHDFFSSMAHSQDDMRVVYDVGELMKKAGHYQGAEHPVVDTTTGKWTMPEYDISRKNSSIEFSKIGKRQQKQSAPHNFYGIFHDPKREAGKQTMWGSVGEGSFEDENYKISFQDDDFQDTSRFAQQRTGSDRFGGLLNLQTGKIELDDKVLAVSGLKNAYEAHTQSVEGLYMRSGSKGITYNGNDFAGINALATELGWTNKSGHITNSKGANIVPMSDIDVEKQAKTELAYSEYKKNSSNSTKGYDDFFNSNEYKSKKSGYYSKEEFIENQNMQAWQAEYGGGLSVNSFARGQQNEIAVDFSKLNLPGVSNQAGVTINSAEEVKSAASALVGVINEEIGKLNNLVTKTKGDELKLKSLEQATSRLSKPESLSSLSLYNTSREGIGGRRLVAHETQHVGLSLIDPDYSIQQKLWNEEFTPTERQQVIAQVKVKMNKPAMGEAECMREYFAEGLANETLWRDNSYSAIKLKEKVKKILEPIIEQKLKEVKH